jgi:hypothetical protein
LGQLLGLGGGRSEILLQRSPLEALERLLEPLAKLLLLPRHLLERLVGLIEVLLIERILELVHPLLQLVARHALQHLLQLLKLSPELRVGLSGLLEQLLHRLHLRAQRVDLRRHRLLVFE